mmetsp:Transcript_41058/g.132021  ORF Transcript_41058/g.132021 Transcript_41058/m.132021 type:complete len:202 (+) Transcript_41058:32-637(+)
MVPARRLWQSPRWREPTVDRPCAWAGASGGGKGRHTDRRHLRARGRWTCRETRHRPPWCPPMHRQHRSACHVGCGEAACLPAPPTGLTGTGTSVGGCCRRGRLGEGATEAALGAEGVATTVAAGAQRRPQEEGPVGAAWAGAGAASASQDKSTSGSEALCRLSCSSMDFLSGEPSPPPPLPLLSSRRAEWMRVSSGKVASK